MGEEMSTYTEARYLLEQAEKDCRRISDKDSDFDSKRDFFKYEIRSLRNHYIEIKSITNNQEG